MFKLNEPNFFTNDIFATQFLFSEINVLFSDLNLKDYAILLLFVFVYLMYPISCAMMDNFRTVQLKMVTPPI